MSGPVHVRVVRTRRDRRAFVAFPYRLYRGSPHWVPPLRRDQTALLDPARNPFFEHGAAELFLAERAGETVGRVAAVVNGRHLDRFADGAGFFGFFECADDAEAAGQLLGAAADWLRARGLTRVYGPTNPSLHDTAGVLTAGFDRRPAVMMPYNPPYYAALLEGRGFREAVGLGAYHAAWKHLDRDRLRRGAALVHGRYPGLAFRPADAARWDAEARLIQDLYARVFADTWGFVPLSDREFARMAREMRTILDPGLVLILEDGGVPVGFSLGLPDVNPLLQANRGGRLTGLPRVLLRARLSPPTEFRVLLLGVVPERRGRGLDALLALETIERGREAGYGAAELGWVMDTNGPLLRALRHFGAVEDKRYALYEKAL